jgi:hypothetical protein
MWSVGYQQIGAAINRLLVPVWREPPKSQK